MAGADCFVRGALAPFPEGAGICCRCAPLGWWIRAQGAGAWGCCRGWEGEEGGDEKLDGSHVAFELWK